MRNIDIFLREKGINPSYQRKRIYEYLHQNPIHPTVNDIYWALIHDIPTLSKATVYNTMNLFSEHYDETRNGFNGSARPTMSPNPGRTWGVRLSYSY